VKLDAVRVLSIVHEHDAGPGVFADVARQRGEEMVEWIPAQQPPPAANGFEAVLVFGGAMNVDQEDGHGWLAAEKELLRSLLDLGTPTLGVCLGAQLLAEVAGGGAGRMAQPEIGWTLVELTGQAAPDPLLGPLPTRFVGFQWHSYEASPPDGAVSLARSEACMQAFSLAAAPWWGIQFHAEATSEMIGRWIAGYRSDEDAVRARPDWEAVRRETDERIGRWNTRGIGICRRFLDHAADSNSRRSRVTSRPPPGVEPGSTA
jgi:GMP synthase-like glutamine amidotransferase